jgi:hypothetical protein
MSVVSILVEGHLDEAVAKKIISSVGGKPGHVYPKRGADYIEKKIDGFNDLAQGIPILTLVDLMDTEFDCPAEAVREWLPHRNEQMLLRFVVREIESWILADRSGIAQMLGIRKAKIPHHPEDLPDPKAALVDLARKSRYDSLRYRLVPEDPTVKTQGPAYTGRIERFIREKWRLDVAQKNSPSLRRCVSAVEAFLEESPGQN